MTERRTLQVMATLKDVLQPEKHDEWVRYFIFPSSSSSSDLQEQLFRLSAACQTIIGDYIWHNEPFLLRRGLAPLSSFDDEDDTEGQQEKCHNGDDNLPYFYGMTHFGDNLEDEWFIVFILRELSKMFPELVVK